MIWEDPIPPISFLPSFLPAFPSGQSGRRQYLLLLVQRGNGLIVVAPSLAPRPTELRSHFDDDDGDRKRGGHRSASKKSVTPPRAHHVGSMDGWKDGTKTTNLNTLYTLPIREARIARNHFGDLVAIAPKSNNYFLVQIPR